MLILCRRIGEEIVIDEHTRVSVCAVRGNHVRLAIYAPTSIRVDRREVHERRSVSPPKGDQNAVKVTPSQGEIPASRNTLEQG